MGKKDFRWRETKKAKKEDKKIKPVSGIIPQAEVELIKKKRKPSEEE